MMYTVTRKPVPAAKVQPAPSVPDRAAMTPAQSRLAALPYDDGIFKTERRYQALGDEYAARDGYASSDCYQYAYR